MSQAIRPGSTRKPSARFGAFRPVLHATCTAVAAIAFAALPARAQKITEVVADHVGSPDTYEYIEVAANPAAVHPTGNSGTVLVDLSSYRIVELDGTTDPGRILHVFQPGTTNGSGFWSTGYMTSTLEKPTFTLLLVSGFTGAVGDDLDPGHDGVLDATPWTAVVDGVAFTDGIAGHLTYTAPALGPGFDGVATEPGGASRFPYYADTDMTTDWKRNDFDGDGLPGFTGTLVTGEARNTPGSVNRVSLLDYYAGVDASSPAALRSTLHALIGNHIRFPYTASTTDTWDILNLADQDPVDSGSILDIYRNATYAKISGGTGVYNREHSWPNSYGFGGATATSEYTDCHHLFASDTVWNGNRGNLPYGTCSSGCTENATLLNHGFGGGSGTYPGNSNWLGSVYEVWNHMRGDLARASLYMDVRYEGGTHPYTGTTETNLRLVDSLSQIQTGQPYMGLLSVLLEWNAQDPPDDAERRRNDVVESFQGNRNPFVDHPEWASCVFQGIGCQAATDPPTVVTGAAGGVTATGAVLNATVNPNGVATTASFEWGPTPSYGSTTGGQSMGSGTAAQPLAAAVSGLTACTTYHYRATATSAGGTANGGDQTFATACPAPAVTTAAATGVTATGAVLNAAVNPNGVATTASFEWGPTTSYGTTTGGQSMGSGTAAQPLATAVSRLAACSTYHYRATATSIGGTINGGDLTFTTACPAPTVTTAAATGVSTTGAMLNATVNANGVATGAFFEWGLTASYGQATPVQPVGAGTTDQPLTVAISGLAPCTIYHYRAVVSSTGGTAAGSDATFRTTCAGSRFYTITPCRSFDTRNDDTRMVDGVPRVVAFHGVCGIPASARAVAANVTVTQPSLAGFLSVYPADALPTGTSVVHFGAGRTRAATTIIKLADDGSGRVRFEPTLPTGGDVHVIIDVSGYFE